MDELWKQAEEKTANGLANEAFAIIEGIYQRAGRDKDDENLTRAIFEMVKIKTGMGEFEKALELLYALDFPRAPADRAFLMAYRANVLGQYYRMYRFDILKRQEKKTGGGEGRGAFKEWSARQIWAAARADLDAAWEARAALGKVPLLAYLRYLKNIGTYPEKVRPTARDFLTQVRAEFLEDQETWTPEQSESLGELDGTALAAPAYVPKPSRRHPLEEMAAAWEDLAEWHDGLKQGDAALDARLQRVLAVRTAFKAEDVKAQSLRTLEALGRKTRALEWWSYLQYQAARILEEDHKYVEAVAAAQEGEKAHPQSQGANLCRTLIARVQAPALNLKNELINPADGQVTVIHRNLKKVYLRAYALGNPVPEHLDMDWDTDDLKELIDGEKPVLEIEQPLTDKGDYREEKDSFALNLKKNGWYLVLASARAGFPMDANRIVNSLFVVSDIGLIVRQGGKQPVQTYCVDAHTGRPVAGAAVRIYRRSWRGGQRRLSLVKQGKTDTEGIFAPGRLHHGDSNNCKIVAFKGDSICPDPAYFYDSRRSEKNNRHLFIYTDRAIYRPDQDVKFKILAVSADTERGRCRVMAGLVVKLRAMDPNGQEIAKFNLATNAWGSASASFTIPRGRLLGGYYLELAKGEGWECWGGRFRVEEYKVPKFTVALDGPRDAMRLNQPAVVLGRADYYYGGPVKQGKVQYQIQRAPVFPRWFGWFKPFGARAQTDNVARGTVKLDADGKFAIPFTPTAAESLKGEKDVSYQFGFSVSVTDEGGETISTQGGYAVGQVSLKADISLPEGLPVAERPFALTVSLSDLTGKPRAGRGTLSIYPLQAGPDPLPPADLLAENLSLSDTNRELAALPRGRRLQEIELEHDNRGIARKEAFTLAPGAYALEYHTQDPFGQDVEAKQFIQVAPAAGRQADLPVSITLKAAQSSVKVGETARFLISSGLPNQTVYYEIQCKGKVLQRRIFQGLRARQVTYPVTGELRGGFTVKLFFVHGYRLYSQAETLSVPWDNQELKLEFVHLRKVMAPGAQETFGVKVSGANAKAATAEVLAFMYDQALDYFALHRNPDIRSLLPGEYVAAERWADDFRNGSPLNIEWFTLPTAAEPSAPGFQQFGYGFGGGVRPSLPRSALMRCMSAMKPSANEKGRMAVEEAVCEDKICAASVPPSSPVPPSVPETTAATPPESLRRNFSETAFFAPQLVTDAKGEVTVTFKTPDSVTAWKLMAYAHGKGAEAGEAVETVRTQKDFMVRPYVPRFVREGDRITIRASIDNKTDRALSGEAFLALEDEDGKDAAARFRPDRIKTAWTAKAGDNANVAFSLKAPVGAGIFKLRVSARSGNWTDGEERPLPLLPSRMHLIESRFTVLKDDVKKNLTLPGLEKAASDPGLITESLVVTLDGQLIYSVLKALPYLYQYPYECVEQTLNRFTAMAVLHGTFRRYPSLAKMAKSMSERKTPLETWDLTDANRKMQLEETPWLNETHGGHEDDNYINALDPRLVAAQTRESLNKLRKAQLPGGGFPWFSGGSDSLYMTLYVLLGLARARAAGMDVPGDMIRDALQYCLANHEKYLWPEKTKDSQDEANRYLSVYLNYMLSCYRQPEYKSWVDKFKRKEMFGAAWKHWRELSPYGRAMLAITLQRAGDAAQAKKVINSLLDIAKTSRDTNARGERDKDWQWESDDLCAWDVEAVPEPECIYWAPEPKAWLWYNDTIESHSFILEAMLEIVPDDPRTDGVALWLLCNKKGNQWKSTRATAEAIFALVSYMSRVESLEAPEHVAVTVPPETKDFDWKPGQYQGKQQWVLDPAKVGPKSAVITLDKAGKGYMFASATWRYSTEKLPRTGDGDQLAVARKYYVVKTKGRNQLLEPVGPDVKLEIGDEVEVELTIQAKTPMEYVHLRDPRGAGFEPEETVSGYHWEQLLGYYEEIRDSATNFFFDWLPQGTYTFRYRIRAANAGQFRAGPATLQSMYAPEFGAHSAGHELEIK